MLPCVLEGAWLIDNDSMRVISGISHSQAQYTKIVLKPGEIYEQKATVSIVGGNLKPGPLTFRLGIRTVGHLTAWSNPITLQEVGAEDAE